MDFKKKNHMITLIDIEKGFGKIQHAFMTKILEGIGMEATYLNIIKAICNIPTSNSILNREKLEAFTLKSGCPPPFQYSA